MRNLLLRVSFCWTTDFTEVVCLPTLPLLGLLFMQHLSLIFKQAFSMRTRLIGLPSVKTVKYKHVKQSRGWTVILHADIVAKIVIVILRLNIFIYCGFWNNLYQFRIDNSLYRFFSVGQRWQPVIEGTLNVSWTQGLSLTNSYGSHVKHQKVVEVSIPLPLDIKLAYGMQHTGW